MGAPVTLRYALAWVYAYVAIYYLLVYLGRRDRREHLAFSLVGIGLALLAVSNANLLDATTSTEAQWAMQGAAAGAILTTASIFEFSELLLRRGGHTWRPLLLGWLVVGLVTAFAGWLVAPSPPDSPPPWNVAGLWHARAEVRPLGHAYFGIGFIFQGGALYRLYLAARAHRDLRAVFVAWLFVAAAGTYDVVGRVLGARYYPFTEIVAVGGVLSMSYVLLRRFTGVGEVLESRTDELLERYADLRETQERLARQLQLAAVGELSAVIAHEVRNPLGIIKNAIGGLRRERTRPEDREVLLDIVDEETDKLNRLMHDLLTYARPHKPGSVPVDVDELLHDAFNDAQHGRFADHGVTVRWNIQLSDDHRDLEGDEGLLRRALANIVENALQSMHAADDADKWIEIGTSAAETPSGEPAVRMYCQDNGGGIPSDVLEKAANPFFTTRPQGTGLGLAIVDRIVSNHGGEFEIDGEAISDGAHGTRITLTLPTRLQSTARMSDPTGRYPAVSATRPGA